MGTKELKKIINGVFLVIFAFFDVILIIRILLKFIGASSKSMFVRFWFNLSGAILSPFRGTFDDIGEQKVILEIDSLVAIVIFSLLGIFFIYAVNALFEEKVQEKFRSLFDLFFKITEVILILRLVFKMTNAFASGFITFLYAISSPFYEPFKGLLPAVKEGDIVFETSTFIAIIIFIILDVATDRILTEVFKDEVPEAPEAKPEAPGDNTQPSPTVNVNLTNQPQSVQGQQPPATPRQIPSQTINGETNKPQQQLNGPERE